MTSTEKYGGNEGVEGGGYEGEEGVGYDGELEPDYKYIALFTWVLTRDATSEKLAARAGVVGGADEIGTVIELISYFFLIIKYCLRGM